MRRIATLVVGVQAFNVHVLMYVMGWGQVVSRAGRGRGGPIVYVLFMPSVSMTRDSASSKELT